MQRKIKNLINYCDYIKKRFGRKNWRKYKEKNVDELKNQIKNIEREENNQKLKDNV